MRLKLAAAAICAAFTWTAHAGEVAFVTNFIGQFGTMDLGTGAFTPIGPGLTNSIDGIGGRPGGPFYGVDSVTGHLIKVYGDGASVDVGDTGTGANFGPTGVSINSSLTTGALYAIDFSNNLLSIDPNTAAVVSLAHLASIAPSTLTPEWRRRWRVTTLVFCQKEVRRSPACSARWRLRSRAACFW
jgi:hypothetical protein